MNAAERGHIPHDVSCFFFFFRIVTAYVIQKLGRYAC